MPAVDDPGRLTGRYARHAREFGTRSEALLQEVLATLEEARHFPMSGSVLVSRDKMFSLVQEAIEALPEDLAEARELLVGREEFLGAQVREGEEILEQVRSRAEQMVQRQEILREAKRRAQRLLEDTSRQVRRSREEVDEYCEQKLGDLERVLAKMIDTAAKGRERLRAAQVPERGGTGGVGVREGASQAGGNAVGRPRADGAGGALGSASASTEGAVMGGTVATEEGSAIWNRQEALRAKGASGVEGWRAGSPEGDDAVRAERRDAGRDEARLHRERDRIRDRVVEGGPGGAGSARRAGERLVGTNRDGSPGQTDAGQGAAGRVGRPERSEAEPDGRDVYDQDLD